MEIVKVLKEISTNISKQDNENIALFSLAISVLAVIITLIFNIISHKQYIRSLNPLLSFRLTKHDYNLYLSISNTGHSEVQNLIINIKSIHNNGKETSLELDELSKKEITLFPNETINGVIAQSGDNISETTFPYIELDISYIKGNDRKKEKYSRTITFTNDYKDSIDLSKLEENITSVAYSNNRIANYIEGRCLFKFDELNVYPNNSLYKDMKDAFNNIERPEKEENEEQPLWIK